MEVNKILNDNLILIGDNSKSKNEILTKLSKLLLDNGYISESEGFLEDVLQREELGATGIGNYIAIPHGKSDYVKETTIAIAKMNEEIEWETIDNKGVKVVILFVVKNSNDFADEHLKLLAQVASYLADDKVLNDLLVADTKNDIKTCFIG